MNSTMPTDNHDAEGVARGLTKAQRKIILEAEEIVVGTMSVNCSDADMYELALLGLVNDLDGDELTPRGLAVRQYLCVPSEAWLVELLYEFDPMCGHEDCKHTASRLWPIIEGWLASAAALKAGQS